MIDFSFDAGGALAGLPEAAPIAGLLADVAPKKNGGNLAASKVGHFFAGVNWRNQEIRPAPAPAAPAAARNPASLKVAAFLKAVNWRNVERAAPAAAATVEIAPKDNPFATENVLKEFVWD